MGIYSCLQSRQFHIPKNTKQPGFFPKYKELLHFLLKPNQRVEAAAAPRCSDTFISPKKARQFVFLSQIQTIFIQLPGENLGKKPSPRWWKRLSIFDENAKRSIKTELHSLAGAFLFRKPMFILKIYLTFAGLRMQTPHETVPAKWMRNWNIWDI